MKILRKSRTGRTLQYFLMIQKKRKFAVSVNIVAPVIALFFGETLVGYNFGILFQKIVEFRIGDAAGELYRLGWLIVILYVVQIIFYRIKFLRMN